MTAATLHRDRARLRRPGAALQQLTAAALAGAGLLFGLGAVFAGLFDEPDLVTLAAVLLSAAVLALSPLRWGPLPGAVAAVGVTFISPLFQDFTVYHLTHPVEFELFVATLAIEACGLVGAGAGFAATWRNYHGAAAHSQLPRWAVLSVAVVTGLLTGATVLAGGLATGVVSADTTISSADASSNSARATVFTAEDLTFTDEPGPVAAGRVAVTLINRGQLVHNVAFEGVDRAEPVVEASAGETATGTVALPPGTSTYFCAVPGHREAGMEGQLTVAREPGEPG